MKKTLLSLLCVVTSVLAASAAEVTDVLTNAGFGIGKSTTYALYSDKKFSSDAVYTMQGAGDSETLQLRSNNNNSGIVSTVSGGKLVSVSLKWNSKTVAGRTVDVYASNTAYTNPTDLYDAEKAGTKIGSLKMDDEVTSITVDGDYTFVGLRSASGALYLDEVSIAWDNGSAQEKVVRPTITPNGGTITATTEISISSATEGAEIWYAYIPDGTDAATVEKQLYTEPFTIPASGSVEAMAKKEGLDDSDVASAAFFIPVDITVDNIAAAVALNDTKNVVIVAGEVAVTFVNGLNIYVKDATGAMCLYDNTKVLTGVKAGDRLTGVAGNYLKYQAGTKGDAFVPEMQNLVEGAATVTEGEAVEPEVLAVEEIGTDMGGAYIKIENATLTASNITDETGSMTIYNSFKIDLTLGKVKSMTGIVTAYAGVLQIAPIEIVPDENAEPAEPVKGDKEDPYTVSEVVALYTENNAVKTTAWVEGYIVGYVTGSVANAESVKFTATDAVNTNMVIADADTESDFTNCVVVQLPSGAIRTALNLKDNPSMLGAKIALQGSIEKYFGVAGVKSATAYEVLKTSGIQAADADAVVISGMTGAVCVTGFEGVVEVYSTLGQLINAAPVSGYAELPARAGLAIVKAGNTVVKVVVK